MTCIVALVEQGITYFAGDSLTVNVPHDYHDGGVSQTVKRETKVFKKQGMLFGASGSVRMTQLLRYELQIPEYTTGRDKMEYLVVDFVNAMKKCLVNADFDGDGLGGNILLGLDGELFAIHKQWNTYNTMDAYDSIGKASEVAVGSLHSTGQLGLPPLQRLKLALLATEHHTCVVKEPFMYITSEMDQAEIIP